MRMLVLLVLFSLGCDALVASRNPSGANSCNPRFNPTDLACPSAGTHTFGTWGDTGDVTGLDDEYSQSDRTNGATPLSSWLRVDNFQFTTGNAPMPVPGTSVISGLEVLLSARTDNNNDQLQIPAGGVRIMADVGEGFRMYNANQPPNDVLLSLTRGDVLLGSATTLWTSGMFSINHPSNPWGDARFGVGIMVEARSASPERGRIYSVTLRLHFTDGTTTTTMPTTAAAQPATGAGPPPTTTTSSTTTSSGNANNPGRSSAPVGAIAGGIVGGLLLIALVVVLIVFVRKRKAKQLSGPFLADTGYTEFDTTEENITTGLLPSNMIL